MKILVLFFLFFAPLNECLQGKKRPNRILKPNLWNGNNKLWRNLFGLKNKGQKDAALTGGFKVQGTARLNNGKVKLDLTMQGPNKNLGDPSATTPPTSSTASTVPTITSPAPLSTTGTPSSGSITSATTIEPTGSVSTTSSSGTPTSMVTSATTLGPTTPAVTSGPTTGAAITTPVAGTTSAGATTSSATTLGPTTPAVTSGPTTGAAITTPVAETTSAGATTSSTPTSSPTNMATSVAPTTLGTAPTSAAGTSLPTSQLTSPATTAPALTSAQPTSPVFTAATTLPTLPVSQPSSSPGVPTKATCETPVNVNIIILAKEVLKTHNAYRRTHGSPDLHLDGQMICDARTFAQEIAFKGVLQHQSSEILARKRLGENIGMSCAPVQDGPLKYGRIVTMAKNVAKRWYDEVCEYNFDQPKAVPSTGHFTEIVWSGSRKLGVGYAVGKNAKFPGYECVYVVGRYKPAGNVIGGQRLKVNVKRGSFNGAYCQRRNTIEGALSNSVGFHGAQWDKRNHLKYKESETAKLQTKKRRLSSYHHSHHRIYIH